MKYVKRREVCSKTNIKNIFIMEVSKECPGCTNVIVIYCSFSLSLVPDCPDHRCPDPDSEHRGGVHALPLSSGHVEDQVLQP